VLGRVTHFKLCLFELVNLLACELKYELLEDGLVFFYHFLGNTFAGFSPCTSTASFAGPVETGLMEDGITTFAD